MRAVERGLKRDRDGSSAGPQPGRSADHELFGGAIDLWSIPVHTLCSFLDRDRALRSTGGAPRSDPAADRWWASDGTRESEAGERGGRYGKIKLHLTRDGSRRHCG